MQGKLRSLEAANQPTNTSSPDAHQDSRFKESRPPARFPPGGKIRLSTPRNNVKVER